MLSDFYFPKQDLVFMCLQYKSVESTAGKGEHARNRAISPFQTEFSIRLENSLPFSSNSNCRLQALSVGRD